MSDKKPKIHAVVFSPDGTVDSFGDGGLPVPELNKTIMELWAEHAKSHGYDVGGCRFEIYVPTPKGVSGAIYVDCTGEVIVQWSQRE